MSDPELSCAIRGWFCACVVASAVLMMFAIDDCVKAQFGISKTLVTALFCFPVTFVSVFIVTPVPSAIFLCLANFFGLRQQPLAYLCFGTALGYAFAFFFKAPPAFAWQLAVAGLAAGTAYWLVVQRERTLAD